MSQLKRASKLFNQVKSAFARSAGRNDPPSTPGSATVSDRKASYRYETLQVHAGQSPAPGTNAEHGTETGTHVGSRYPQGEPEQRP